MKEPGNKTIQDFGDQWSKYKSNDGWYGSSQLFKDITSPLLEPADLEGKSVVDIGSGTGRIVSMLLEAGAASVFAVEPATGAFETLVNNVKHMQRASDVTCINTQGASWTLTEQVDYVLSIGVIHHIPEPEPVIARAFVELKPGGHIFLWVYGYEGNELYLRVFQPLRKITISLPHLLLRGVVELIYGLLFLYRYIGKVIPVPLYKYISKVLWPMTPAKRRLVIYDQLNPAYAKYYKKDEIEALLKNAGFENVQAHHRHGYSWSVIGRKPIT